MAQVTIEINTDNAAFCDEPGFEVMRILEELGEKFEMFPVSYFKNLPQTISLMDFNGNNVGECKVTES